MSTGPWEGGKGSRPRKYSVNKYQDNYERIFGNAAIERGGKEVISLSVTREIAAGRPSDQAAAIAYKKAGKSKKK